MRAAGVRTRNRVAKILGNLERELLEATFNECGKLVASLPGPRERRIDEQQGEHGTAHRTPQDARQPWAAEPRFP